MKLKTMAMTGVMSLAGLGLIGAGADAVFTATTTSSQTITAGTMNVVVSAPGATETSNSGDVCTSAADDCTTITLPSFGPVGSTFATTPVEVTITNNGKIPVSEVAVQLSDTNNNATLETETWACYYAPESTGVATATNPLVVLANEPLTTIEGYGPTAYIGTIPPAGTDTYYVVFYAGDINTGCGPTYSLEQPIAYGGYANAYWPPSTAPDGPPANPANWFDVLPTTGATPPASDNPAAASLQPLAEGGVLTPTMTYTYNG